MKAVHIGVLMMAIPTAVGVTVLTYTYPVQFALGLLVTSFVTGLIVIQESI